MERFTLSKESAIGPYMGTDPNGAWCHWDAANARIAALEAQVKALTEDRDAQAEAVRVLGAWLRLWRLFKGRPRSEVDAPGAPYRVFRDAQREVWNNPIARAAVEGGGA